MVTTGLIALLLCFGGALGAGTHLLYPHTENNGDTKFYPEYLDWYNEVSLVDTYWFYGVDYTNLFVSTKGVVTFEWGWTSYIPSPMTTVYTPMIAPLWSDNNLGSPDQGENILYRETQDPELLTRFSDDVNGFFSGCGGPSFMPTSLVIVTWQRVQSWCPDVGYDCWWDYYYYDYYRDDSTPPDHVYPLPSDRDNVQDVEREAMEARTHLEGINGFQLVLATDGEMTFAMYNMHTIEWTCCGDWNRSGFSDGVVAYTYELPDSGTSDVDNLTTGSNVGKAGRWIFRVDPCNILDPQCVWL